jgi:hypothetical protein
MRFARTANSTGVRRKAGVAEQTHSNKLAAIKVRLHDFILPRPAVIKYIPPVS